MLDLFPRQSLAVLLLPVALCGACETPWKVTKSTDPGPLNGAGKIQLAPVSHEGLLVDGIAEAPFAKKHTIWVERKPGNEVKLLEPIRAHLKKRDEGLDPSVEELTLRLHIVDVQTGYDSMLFETWKPWTVDARAIFVNASGDVLYSVSFDYEVVGPMTVGPLRRCYAGIGRLVVKYLECKL